MVLLSDVRVNSKFYNKVGRWICVHVDRSNDSILAVLEKDLRYNGQQAVAHRYGQDHLDGFTWKWSEARAYWGELNPRLQREHKAI